jgi:hypothetical protein
MSTNNEVSNQEGANYKPRVFVGSSVESLDVAYAVQENLEFAAEITVWTQGVFDLTRPALNSLLGTIGTFDFAIFIFAPDDVLKMKDETMRSVRDNVVFELGLFMGELGEDRAFIILPRCCEDLHLPTDLAGVTPATYEPNRRDQNLNAALGPPCTRISRAMRDNGIRQPLTVTQGTLPSPVASGLSEELRAELARMLEEQNERIQQAFEKFEQRLNSTSMSQLETAKAPLSRISHIIREKLSPVAKALLAELTINNKHLTLEQYQALYDTEFSAPIEELRANNLIEPVVGFDKDQNKIHVYFLSSRNHRVIRSVVTELPPQEISITTKVREALAAVGYNQ